MKKQKVLRKKFQKETGAGLIEYALLVALISVISIAGLRNFGQTIFTSLKTSEKTIEFAIGGSTEDECDPNVELCLE